MPRIIGALLAAVALTCALPVPASATPHVLTFADGADLTGLNPLRPEAAPNYELNYLTMGYLTRYGERGLTPELLATLPTPRNGGISADGKTIVFKLKRGLKWSDGAPLTAADVAFSVTTIQDPSANSQYLSTFTEVEGVDAPDDVTAIFHLKRPHGHALAEYFSSRSAAVLPKHLLAGVAINGAPYLQLPIGAGPFRYTKWVRGDRVELERNPYYALGTPKLERIVYKMIPTITGTITALRTGEIDIGLSATYPDYKPIENEPAIKLLTLPGVRPSNFALNVSREPLNDINVRRALRLGTDRASILQRSYLGSGVLAESRVNAGDPFVAHIPLVRYDLAAANALLERSGWKRGTGGVRAKNGRQLALEVIGGAGSAFVDQILELTRANWTALGVAVTTKRYPLSLMFAPADQGGILFGGKYDVALFSTGEVSAADAAGPECKEIPPHGTNFPRLCDPAFDASIERANSIYDSAVAGPLYRAIQVRQFELAPYIILALRNELWLSRTNVSGVKKYPFAYFYDPLTLDVDN